MKEEYNREGRRSWAIWISIIAILLIGIGIFFYYTFLRQTKSELIEAVPIDAVFLYELNDNDGFVKSVQPLQPCFNELFAMDAFNAYESVYHKLYGESIPATISGHNTANGFSLLFNTRIEKAAFKKLLRSLSIDPANYTAYEQHKIYTYGTNYKSLKFVYFNHILSISDNIELLEKALMQHTHPKNLLSNKSFKSLYDIAEKNKKQNWILINNSTYFDFLGTFFNPDVTNVLDKIKDYAQWSAYQLRISKNEVFLSGYVTTDSPKFSTISSQASNSETPADIMPINTPWYYKVEMPKQTSYRFALVNDSAQTHRYLAIACDTLKHAYTPFQSDAQAETYNTTYPDGLYPITDSICKPNLSEFDKDDYRFFIEKDGYYIFASSQDDIRFYLNKLNNSTLTENRFYQLASSNTASNSLLEFSFFNSNNQALWQKKLSDKGRNTHFGQQLKIFTISFNSLDDNFATVNIYAGF